MNLIGYVVRSKLLRFAMVGVFGLLVNEAALFVCLRFTHLDKVESWFPAFLAAVTFTWLGNRTITFREHAGRSGLLAEWAAFVVANSVGAITNYCVYFALVKMAPAPISNPLLALAAGAVAGMLFNFSAAQRFVFRKNSAQP